LLRAASFGTAGWLTKNSRFGINFGILSAIGVVVTYLILGPPPIDMSCDQPRVDSGAGRILAGAVYVITILLAIYVTHIYLAYPQTDDAYVRADTVGIAPRVSGPIIDLTVRDNQRVKKGDMLFIVDPRPYQAELDSAVATVDLTNLQIGALGNSISAAKERQTQLEADRAYDQQYLDRIMPLLSENFVTANEVSGARSKLAAARAAMISLLSQ
jgi:multidrug efflux system membrane fusion protein